MTRATFDACAHGRPAQELGEEELMDTKQEVRQFIVKNFYVSGGDELSEEASLLDQGIVDSTGVLEVIAFLEKAFGIQVDDAEMVPANLDSIRAIAARPKRWLASKKRSASTTS